MVVIEVYRARYDISKLLGETFLSKRIIIKSIISFIDENDHDCIQAFISQDYLL